MPRLNVLSPIVVAMEFEQAAIFKKFDRRSNQWVRRTCPDALGKAYIDNSNLWKCNELLGLIDHPIITSQGGIIMQRGYDKKSKLFFVHRLEIEPIQDQVSRESALDALEEIIETIREFPFADEASVAAAVAMILTPYVRHSVPFVPLFCVTAPTQGTGKTMLASLPSFIATGTQPIIMSFPNDENELEKKLSAHFMCGDRHILIDNITKVLKNDFLAKVISSVQVSSRVLGESKNWVGEPTVCISATGNNLAIGGDLPRRIMMAHLSVNMEHPELRQFDRNLVAYVQKHRARLIQACLLVLRGGIQENARIGHRAKAEQHGFVGFDDWNAVVLNTLVWLGLTNPHANHARVGVMDQEQEDFSRLIACWFTIFGEAATTANGLMQAANRVEPTRSWTDTEKNDEDSDE
ncbi:MAG: hypothetical protein ACRESZ_17315, partial [Methylococcales bacterium]